MTCPTSVFSVNFGMYIIGLHPFRKAKTAGRQTRRWKRILAWLFASGLAGSAGLALAGSNTAAAGNASSPARVTATNSPVALCREAIRKLRPLHKALAKPMRGDWLDKFQEPGQTFEQWLASRPRMALGKRNVIYIQPMGQFDKTDRKIIEQTSDFMRRYFGLKVTMLEGYSLDKIPASARRTHPAAGNEQILTGYVINSVLKPALPADAAVLVALTSSDLWPGQGWNFVFGQASLDDRVGVWSIARMGDPALGEAAFREVLLRTCKVATHETGHMFGILHCTAWECNMCGCNSQEESDRHPLWCCPDCMAKICIATGSTPAARYRRLTEFCTTNGLATEANFYIESANMLEK